MRKSSRPTLLTVDEYLKTRTHITRGQLRHSLRLRHENGLAPFVFLRPVGYKTLLLDAPGVDAWYARVVPA